MDVVVKKRQRDALLRFVDDTVARGEITFTTAQAEQVTDYDRRGLAAAIRRLTGKGRIVSAGRGFFVIVPPEYRSMGSPPVEWWLDDLMTHLGSPYYIGLKSAAEFHGYSHYAVMETQVVTEKPRRKLIVGRVVIRFIQKVAIDRCQYEARQNSWGKVNTATPEMTILDLLHYHAVGTEIITEVLSACIGLFRIRRLKAVLATTQNTSAIQRLGYLLDIAGKDKPSKIVAQELKGRPFRAIPLEPGSHAATNQENPWKVSVSESDESQGW